MTIPKQVEEAANLAEEYLKELSESQEAGSNDDGETPNDGATKEEPKKSDTSVNDEGNDEADDDDDKEGEADEEVDSYRKKYDTLQGKYNAEVPRLHKEIKNLKEDIFKRIGEITEKQKETPPVVEEVLDDEDLKALKSEFGDELFGKLDAYFESKMKPLIKKDLEEAITPVRDKVDTVEESQVSSAQAEFAAFLDENIKGNWREAWEGNDPKFVEFLKKSDPSGLYTYQDLIEQYNTKWDHERLAKVMNIFYEESNPDVKKEDLSEEKEARKKEKKKDKEFLVAPSRKTKESHPSSSDKIIWTEATIAKFKIDDRKGRYSAEESAELWNDLLHALAENRIK